MGSEGLMGPSGQTTRPLCEGERSYGIEHGVHISSYTRESTRGRVREREGKDEVEGGWESEVYHLAW